MARKASKDSSIILPWERRGGFFRHPGMTRARPLLLALAVIVVFVVVGYRERNAARVRASRATMLVVRQAVDAYRAANDMKCPSLQDLVMQKYLDAIPTDAWGRTLILTCPGRFDPQGYELSSAGPDGLPGGLDRVE